MFRWWFSIEWGTSLTRWCSIAINGACALRKPVNTRLTQRRLNFENLMWSILVLERNCWELRTTFLRCQAFLISAFIIVFVVIHGLNGFNDARRSYKFLTFIFLHRSYIFVNRFWYWLKLGNFLGYTDGVFVFQTCFGLLMFNFIIKLLWWNWLIWRLLFFYGILGRSSDSWAVFLH